MVQVINVISILDGIIQEIKSFPFNDSGCELGEIERKNAITEAEIYYWNKVNQYLPDLNYTFEDAEEDCFSFDDEDGLQIDLIWSV